MSCSRAALDGWAWWYASMWLWVSGVCFISCLRTAVCCPPLPCSFEPCGFTSPCSCVNMSLIILLVSLWTYLLRYTPNNQGYHQKPAEFMGQVLLSWRRKYFYGPPGLRDLPLLCSKIRMSATSFWVKRNRQTKTWASVWTSINCSNIKQT